MADRLSSIETIDEAGIPAVQAAYDAIVSRRATQTQILAVLNADLAALGLGPVFLSSFNRYVAKVRDGMIQRPLQARAFDPSSGLVFDPGFRERLVQSIGETAALKMQIALAALAGGRV